MRTDVELGRLRVRRVTLSELDSCMVVRRTVFIEEQQVSEEEEIDGLDPECSHFLAEYRSDVSGYIDDGWEAVGTARMRVVPAQGGTLAKAERVAVLAQHRKHGVGRALMLELEADARRWGHLGIKLGSQEEAMPFYKSLGYTAYGERFMDANIPHFWMKKIFTECEV